MPGSLGRPAIADQTLIVDSWPVMESLKQREPATSKFRAVLSAANSGEIALLLSSINLGDIFYNCWNEWNEVRAEAVLEGLRIPPIRVVHPTQEDALAAARIKGQYKVSCADAFAAVLAIEFGAPVLTGDPDFLKMQRGGLITVEWFGK